MRTFAGEHKLPSSPVLSRQAAAPGLPAEYISVRRRIADQQPGQRMLQAHAEEPGIGLAAAASRQFTYDFSRIPVRATMGKTAVNRPGDEYEQEADRVSKQVMRMPEPKFQPEGQRRQPRDLSQSAATSFTADVLGSSGRPLDTETRAFMEARFDHDFSQVRVHTDSRAARSSQSISARAYTAGRDIVFNAGQYSPRTDTGKHLLAHELAHVVQQPGQGDRVYRKEINKSLVSARRGNVAPGDWLDLDRQEWEMASQNGNESSLSPTNTFMRAVYYNTQNLRPQEYATVRERHDYYDLISYVLEHDRNTPAALKGVRFFHATTAVTGSPGLGSVDTGIGSAMLQQDTRQIIREVNAELFALNMGVIQNLLFNWREPRNPKSSAVDPIKPFEFDIKMVETEQETVEEYIRRNRQRFTSSVTKEINDTLDPDAFGQFFNFSRTSFEWAKNTLQVQSLDFTDQTHRQAIGFAAVHIFHRKTLTDYQSFMRARMVGDYPVTTKNAG